MKLSRRGNHPAFNMVEDVDEAGKWSTRHVKRDITQALGAASPIGHESVSKSSLKLLDAAHDGQRAEIEVAGPERHMASQESQNRLQPIHEQQFVGDTLSVLASRFTRKKGDLGKLLGPASRSGIVYYGLRKRQDGPVLPLHLASFREEKSMTLLIEGHPYWQMFEFGAFNYNATIPFFWPSSYSGRQIFVTPDEEFHEYLSAYMGGIEVQKRPISFEEETSDTGGNAFRLRTELPSGEDFEVYLHSKLERTGGR